MRLNSALRYANPISATENSCRDQCAGYGTRADCPPLIVLASRVESGGACCHHDSIDPGESRPPAVARLANLAFQPLHAGPVKVAHYIRSFALTRRSETRLDAGITRIELDRSSLERD